jgi:hypothetical protein
MLGSVVEAIGYRGTFRGAGGMAVVALAIFALGTRGRSRTVSVADPAPVGDARTTA